MRTIVCGRWNKHSSRHSETKTLWTERNLVDKGELARAALAPRENAVSELIVRELAASGIDIIGDGDIRNDSVYDVTRRITGCSGFTQLTRIPKTNHFHRQPVATLPLRREQPLIVEQFTRSQRYASHPMVACLPGPYTTARQTANVEDIGLPRLAQAYASVFREEMQALLNAGATFVRIEEPQIVDYPEDFDLFAELISELVVGISDTNRIMLATWFGDVTAMPSYYDLPVGAFWLDFVEGKRTLETVRSFHDSKQLVAGIFDARHSYAEDPSELSRIVGEITKHVSHDRLFVAPNADLHFLPWNEALEKTRSIVAWSRAYREGSLRPASMPRVVSARSNDTANASALTSSLVSPLAFGNFPTSAVGSYPQSKELRSARVALRKGTLTEAAYRTITERYTEEWMAFQRDIDMTVPVGGEFLREDMAVYFSVQFGGRTLDFVPSYENRRYRPVEFYAPIIRSGGALVNDFRVLQGFSDRLVKETITGPATLADWALLRHPPYYRDRRTFRRELAQALRSDMTDLINAGVKILQVDEPALTTNMEYFPYDIEAIYETITGFEKDIYLILHLCYSDMESLRVAFPDILKLPFHQIHMEMANRDYALLELVDTHGFCGKDIGLGVVDVHKDRIETVPEIVAGVSKALRYFTPSQIWLTPDCGLKERSEAVSQAKLRAMCEAAALCRSRRT